MLLTSAGYRPGLLLNIVQCTGQPPQQRILWPHMSIVQRLKHSDLNV